jgi:hypothetical protein
MPLYSLTNQFGSGRSSPPHALPWVRIDERYVFDTANGTASSCCGHR